MDREEKVKDVITSYVEHASVRDPGRARGGVLAEPP